MSQSDNSSLLTFQRHFKISYGVWLGFRLLVMPFVMLFATAEQLTAGGQFLFWQILTMIPALLFVAVVGRANQPYRLIVLSFLVMVYLGIAASYCLIAWYEQKGILLVLAYACESGLLFLVLGLLFLVLKKLPPMHKNTSNQ